MNCGVYSISFRGRLYVGSAVNIPRRWAQHKLHLRKGKHHSRHLQRAWAKYGGDEFVFSVLEAVEDSATLLSVEQKYLDQLNPDFNSCKVAGSQLGRRHSEETKRKLSEILKGRPRDPQSIERQRIAQRGRVVSAETRAKISASHKGVALSESHKEALRIARRERALHSAETKRRMSVSQQLRRAKETFPLKEAV